MHLFSINDRTGAGNRKLSLFRGYQYNYFGISIQRTALAKTAGAVIEHFSYFKILKPGHHKLPDAIAALNNILHLEGLMRSNGRFTHNGIKLYLCQQRPAANAAKQPR
jgi:hypothetical protein